MIPEIDLINILTCHTDEAGLTCIQCVVWESCYVCVCNWLKHTWYSKLTRLIYLHASLMRQVCNMYICCENYAMHVKDDSLKAHIRSVLNHIVCKNTCTASRPIVLQLKCLAVDKAFNSSCPCYHQTPVIHRKQNFHSRTATSYLVYWWIQ